MKMLSNLSEFAPHWNAYFKNDTEKLEDLIIHLALGCEKGGAKIISLLLDGTSYHDANIAEQSNILLGNYVKCCVNSKLTNFKKLNFILI